MPGNPSIRTPGTPPILGNQSNVMQPGIVTSQSSMPAQGGLGMNINKMGPLGNNRVSIPSFVSTSTTVALPSITDSFNISKQVSSCYPEGSLPSIPSITSAASPFVPHNDSESQMRASVIEDILEVCG